MKNFCVKILLFLAGFLFTKELRHSCKTKIMSLFLTPKEDELKIWSNIMSNRETLEYIIERKCSISRFGDGEIGYLVNDNFNHFFQPFNKILQEKLRYILLNPIDSCLIAVPSWLGQKETNEFPIRFQVNYWNKMKVYANQNVRYGLSFCFGTSTFRENNIELVKKIWEGKDVVLVTGKGSTFVWEDDLFNNVKSHNIILTKSVDAFSEYDKIIEEVSKYDKDCIILMALGLTATVLAYDLSLLGYQAIDIGHVVNSYLTVAKGVRSIDGCRQDGIYIDGETDIKKIIEEDLRIASKKI